MTRLVFLFMVSGCSWFGIDPGDAPVSPEGGEPQNAAAKAANGVGEPKTPEDRAAVDTAKKAIEDLGKTLAARLKAGMSDAGPASSVRMCAASAQPLTEHVSERNMIPVGRSSLRLRNPANAGPDWVMGWLVEQGERGIEGVKARAQVLDTDHGRVARVLHPIGIKPMCLKCHGDPETFVPAVKTFLAERFPEDQAVGYEVGQLRGAFWAEAPVVVQ